MTLYKWAHISDIHYAECGLLSFLRNPWHYCSKAFLAYINHLFQRKNILDYKPLESLAEFLQKEAVSTLLISGDFTTSSHPAEFKKAQKFIEQFSFPVYAVPGNHDVYTKKAEKAQRFYTFLDSSKNGATMQQKGCSLLFSDANFSLIGLDSARATSWISSEGEFGSEHAFYLRHLLEKIPQNHTIFLLHHFPLFCNDSPKKGLKGRELLQQILQEEKRTIYYLHGHNHRQSIADLRPNNLPVLLEPGSISWKNPSFHLLEFTKERMCVKVYTWNAQWTLKEQRIFAHG